MLDKLPKAIQAMVREYLMPTKYECMRQYDLCIVELDYIHYRLQRICDNLAAFCCVHNVFN